jgi:hypothetical protein
MPPPRPHIDLQKTQLLRSRVQHRYGLARSSVITFRSELLQQPGIALDGPLAKRKETTVWRRTKSKH